MTFKVKNSNIILFLAISMMILITNYSLYNSDVYASVPKQAALASLIDFMLVFPFCAYYFLLRKRFSLKKLGLAVLVGYGASIFIIPDLLLAKYSFLPYMIGAFEGVFLLFEFYFALNVIRNIVKMEKQFNLRKKKSYFYLHLVNAIAQSFPSSKMLRFWASEIAIYYYAIFSWRNIPPQIEGKTFTFHKKTSAIAVYVMLIHATVVETIGLHYFLHQWNPFFSYILLFFNIYGLLFFLGEIQSIRLNPFLLLDHELYMQVGITKGMSLPYSNIKSFHIYTGAEKFSRLDEKSIFDARGADFILEKPAYEILLHKSQPLRLMYGFTKQVNRIVLNVDEGDRFFYELMQRLLFINPENNNFHSKQSKDA